MKKKTRATAPVPRNAAKPVRGAQGRAQARQAGKTACLAAACAARRRQAVRSPAQGPAGQGAGANRGTAGFRGYRLPAGYSQPARLRARAPSLDRLYQALSCQRRADRARRRSLEADQRRLRACRGRSGAEGDRGGAAAPCALVRRGRAAGRRRVRAAAVEPERNRCEGQGGGAGASHRPADIHLSRPHRDSGRFRGRSDPRPPCRGRPRAGRGR